MVRAARRTAESNIYHVISRGCGKQLIFEDDDDRNVFLYFLRAGLDERAVDLLAWCLMENHVHLLLHAPLEDVSELMRTLNSTYAMHFNKRHDRVGHLLQGRFKSEPVDSDEYLMTVVRYIHLNPQKAGICEANRYPWSSYQEYLGATPHLIEKETVLGIFDGEKQFVAFHENDSGSDPCIDVGRGRRIIDEESALHTANEVLWPAHVESVTRLGKAERDHALRTLKDAHLSLRQIERLTGVSKSVVAEVVHNR